VTESEEPEIGGDLPPLDPDLAAWLAADPDPTMPDEVWARIEERLAAEQPLAAVVAPTATVDLAAARTRRRSRVLPVLVGAAGVAIVGAVVLPTMRTAAPVSDVPASAQPAAAAGSPGQAGPQASPDASTRSAQAPAPPNADAMPRAMVATGTDYTADAMPAQVATVLADAGMADTSAVAEAAASTASPSPPAMPGLGIASDPLALADCLGRLGLPPEATPLLVDGATFDGREAGVIVTVGASDASGVPTALHVVAVGRECTEADVEAAQHWDLPLGTTP